LPETQRRMYAQSSADDLLLIIGEPLHQVEPFGLLQSEIAVFMLEKQRGHNSVISPGSLLFYSLEILDYKEQAAEDFKSYRYGYGKVNGLIAWNKYLKPLGEHTAI